MREGTCGERIAVPKYRSEGQITPRGDNVRGSERAGSKSGM